MYEIECQMFEEGIVVRRQAHWLTKAVGRLKIALIS
jgi:hypothetical protein